jgi:glutathione S-transferase
VKVTLYTTPGSHPGEAALAMLRYKGIEFKRRYLVSVAAKLQLRAMGFPGTTVPAMKIDGRRVQTSREISRELDRVQPEPPLFPADPEQRAAVEEAERWGDEELQHPVRQTALWAISKDKKSIRSFLQGVRLGMPVWMAAPLAPTIVSFSARLNGATEEAVRADLAALGPLFQHVDDLIESDTIGGEQLNAADFQIAASLRLAMALDDLRPLIESRPAGQLALRVIPEHPGRVGPTLPPAWLQPLRSAAVSA